MKITLSPLITHGILFWFYINKVCSKKKSSENENLTEKVKHVSFSFWEEPQKSFREKSLTNLKGKIFNKL